MASETSLRHVNGPSIPECVLDLRGQLVGVEQPRLAVPQLVRFGAHSNAMYFGMVGKRSENVWSWNYVLPGRSGSVVWTKKSDTEYAVDGPTYPQDGKMVTEHHICKKSA